ncbi:uncharacterized protein LOC122000884 [Zingiber officinale]|uniref:uncharacterized protein LOC122000884 n=1 Tax=Zingiber officinale TaxID=94328 RepID=UPI001C4C7BCF|nr:uncharacterized protein LOC122000884 [Zingiber officinale]
MVEKRTHPLSSGAPTPAEELPTANTPRAAAKHPYLKVRFLAIFSDLIFRSFQSEEITEESPEMAILKILDEFLAKIKSNDTRLTMKELEVTLNNFKDLKKILLEKIEEIERGNLAKRWSVLAVMIYNSIITIITLWW